MKPWDSTLVHWAKVVLLVSNLICCFIFHFFSFYQSCFLCITEAMEPPFKIKFFNLALHIMTFEMRPLIMIYPYTVLSFSKTLIVAAWFTQWQGEAVSTQNWACLKFSLGANIINLPTCQQLETPLRSHRLLWQLPWALFRTHMTCCYGIDQVTVFQRQSSILSNKPSYLKCPLFLFAVIY